MRHMKAVCYDCGRAYGDEYGFPDLTVQKSVWAKISPTGHEGGLLCPSCLIRRVVDAGLTDVPARFASGPLRMVGREEMKAIFNDPNLPNVEYMDYEQEQVHAVLVLAAPKLLAACKEALRWLRGYGGTPKMMLQDAIAEAEKE